MLRIYKIALLFISFTLVGAVIIYWANSNFSENLGISNPSKLHTGITVVLFALNFLHIRILGNIIFEERLINYVIEDGSVVDVSFDPNRKQVRLEIHCPLSSKHPEYRQPLDQLYRFLGGSIYLSRDGKIISLVFSECKNVEEDVMEPRQYERVPEQIVDWGIVEDDQEQSIFVQTNGAYYAFEFDSFEITELGRAN